MYQYDDTTRELRGTHFEMVRFDSSSSKVTKLEAHFNKPENVAFALPVDNPCLWGGFDDAPVPICVSAKLWEEALANPEDPNALANVNKLQPGCIYKNNTLLTEIVRQTSIAAYSTDGVQLQNARKWLKKVCVPYTKGKERADVLPQHIASYYPLYTDVALFRGVHKKTGSRSKVLRYFPELRDLEGEARSLRGTKEKYADRRNWREYIFDYGKSTKEATSKIYAEVLGYKQGRTLDKELKRYYASFSRDIARWEQISDHWAKRILS